MVSCEEFVTIVSGGIPLRAVIVSPSGISSTPALILCHGAFEYKERYLDMARYAARAGITTLVPDMHGHGESGGKRFEIQISRWIQNIRDCIDFLTARREVNADRIAAFGLSTGGTAVIEAAIVEQRLKAIIAYAPTVRNVMTVADMLLYFCVLPLGFLKKVFTGRPLAIPMPELVKGRKLAWDNDAHRSIIEDPYFQASYVPIPGALQASWVTTITRADQVTIPTLVMHGEADQVDSPLSSKMLYERLTCIKKLALLPEMGHVASVERHRDAMYRLTVSWLHEHLS
jgi:uncharacterized protein